MFKRKFQQISADQREVIYIRLNQGFSMRAIARDIGRPPSTVSREIRRNGSELTGLYLGSRAQKRSDDRRKISHRKPRLKNKTIHNFVIKHLKRGISPELIAGRLQIKHPGLRISHEAIYQFIYKEQSGLIRFLVRGHRKRHKRRFFKKQKRNLIPGRKSIVLRPAAVERRTTFGHFESDSMESTGGRQILNVVIERKSRFIKITRLQSKSPPETSRAIIKKLGRLKIKIKTITYDNGIENRAHAEVNAALKCKSFFCAPYHSWEKGTVENGNMLIRRRIPKGTNLSTIPNKRLRAIEKDLNDRPRKCLNFRTPREVLLAASVAFAH